MCTRVRACIVACLVTAECVTSVICFVMVTSTHIPLQWGRPEVFVLRRGEEGGGEERGRRGGEEGRGRGEGKRGGEEGRSL